MRPAILSFVKKGSKLVRELELRAPKLAASSVCLLLPDDLQHAASWFGPLAKLCEFSLFDSEDRPVTLAEARHA